MKQHIVIGLLRLGMGWIFLWAFLDKVFGLGYATTFEKSWLSGGSPTTGFLKFATHGPFKELFSSLAGNTAVDILFMTGLFCVGTALLLGIARKLSTLAGSLLLLLMWLSLLPPENNPFIDDHIIYILVLQLLLHLHSGEILGLGKWWEKTGVVKKYPLMK